MEYEFTFVITGATVDDEAAVDSLRDELDALLARGAGTDLVVVSSEGDGAVKAALRAASAVRAAVPGLRAVRLDRDLVGVPEIADRTGRSRQNVAQWVTGGRKASGAPFPTPEGTAGRSRVWLWAEVNEWLRQYGLDDGANYPTRSEMVEIDFALANGVSLSLREASPDPAHRAGRQAVVDGLQADHIPNFMHFLSRLDGVTDEHGDHIVVVACADEPAHEVMDFVASFDHDVVLVTKVDDFLASVLSTRGPNGPANLVNVPAVATVRDWMDLVRRQPRAAFTTAECAPADSSSTAAPITRLMAIAA
ncbi:helix-turn-helix transcriptional regulator [Streptomyces sp. NPDC092296]|uniref:helix-turn-helix transcriptional regulator n=1 Tax=Streptomyces sp. NPDC092296 TaxID=3366012 RepID=UPI0037F14ED9